MHDTIDQLVDEIRSIHQSLPANDASIIRRHCPEPASAWAAESALAGKVLPVNPATAMALAGAAASLRDVARTTVR